jgi:NMD protein affecting ribosome stability and mRNA decay
MSDDDDETEDWSIAYQIVDGAQCSHCGVCFDEHGYPVLCESCYKQDKGRSGIQKATNPEY